MKVDIFAFIHLFNYYFVVLYYSVSYMYVAQEFNVYKINIGYTHIFYFSVAPLFL